MTAPVQPGDVLANKYRVERVLGAGGMGVVVLAMDIHLERQVAIKLLLPEALQNTESIRRFIQEARAAARIRGDHVVKVHDVGTLESGNPYLVMEYLEGQDLGALVEARKQLGVQEAVDYLLQACEAIAEAHVVGIIHRDLKPANLFLSRAPDGTRSIKVLDFGISKIAPKAGADPTGGMTNTRALMGSPLYMSPEQMRSTKKVTVKSDVWALGVILYELLAGSPPFVADTMPEVCAMVLTDPLPPLLTVRPDVPRELEAILARCTDKNPDARYDVAQLAQALAPFASVHGQLSAEKIARFVTGGSIPPPRGSVASMPAISSNMTTPGKPPFPLQDMGTGPTLASLGPEMQAPTVPAGTLATFGKTGPTPSTRTRSIVLALGGGVVVLLGLVGGLVYLVGGRAGGGAAAVGAGSTSTPTSTSTSTSTSTPTSTADAAAPEVPSAAPVVSAPAPVVRPSLPVKPRLAAPAPKPAHNSTEKFGKGID